MNLETLFSVLREEDLINLDLETGRRKEADSLIDFLKEALEGKAQISDQEWKEEIPRYNSSSETNKTLIERLTKTTRTGVQYLDFPRKKAFEIQALLSEIDFQGIYLAEKSSLTEHQVDSLFTAVKANERIDNYQKALSLLEDGLKSGISPEKIQEATKRVETSRYISDQLQLLHATNWAEIPNLTERVQEFTDYLKGVLEFKNEITPEQYCMLFKAKNSSFDNDQERPIFEILGLIEEIGYRHLNSLKFEENPPYCLIGAASHYAIFGAYDKAIEIFNEAGTKGVPPEEVIKLNKWVEERRRKEGLKNELIIDGELSLITNPNTNLPMFLNAEYMNEKYVFSTWTGPQDNPILHFSREDRIELEDGLNFIMTLTSQGRIVKALGISQYDRGDGTPCWYRLGDDLEIKVSESAANAVEQIPSLVSSRS